MMSGNVLITGAGSGIGRAVSLFYLRRGYHVYGLGRNGDALERVAQEPCEGLFTPLVGNVANRSQLERALANLHEIRIVVINAGVCCPTPLNSSDADDLWRYIMGTNLDGVWNTFRCIRNQLVQGARIVAISSGLGKLGRAGYGAYSASKHAVNGLVKCFAKELAPQGITVNAVCPGWVDTEMAHTDLKRMAAISNEPLDATFEQVKAHIPLKRFVQPEEVASLVGWLTSDSGGAVTGQAYNISCGEFFA